MKRILVIDDEAMIRSIFKRFFIGQGYAVNCAENGEKGLAILEDFLPDLVITDIMMPDVDGLEVVQSIRSNHPHIPVLVISGGIHSVPEDSPRVDDRAGCKVFYKPINLDKLLDGVKEMLGEQ